MEKDRISGEKDWQKKSYNLSVGSRTLKWEYVKNSSVSEGDDCGWVDGLVVGTEKLYPTPDEFSEALDSDLKFTGDKGSWWIATGSGTNEEYYYDADAICINADTGEETCLRTIVDSDSSETIKFHWKISGESGSDYLRFYIDGVPQASITGEQDWQAEPNEFTVSAGIHTFKWAFSQGGSSGDQAWVDFVQWSGPSAAQDPANFQTINYKHDIYGRRIEKEVDGFSTRYLYDGDQVIAEYDGNNNLLRKYIYGPGLDEPVCMIEVAESETYYYHFDALGSVVALSDSSGDSVQTYQYSVSGQVAASDVNHPNPYMFVGRRYDIEIGQYYNRARYYNPYTGRFLQSDPIGYKAGMNLYAYCRNNALNYTDPSGCVVIISPRVILPPNIAPAPTHGVRPWTIASGHPQAYQLCWQAMTGNGGDLIYTDSAACWEWASADTHWMLELKREISTFVVGFWRYARDNHFDPETNTFNLDGWDYDYPLSGTYTTPSIPPERKISFGAELAENGYSKFNSKFWIHNTQVEIDYSISFDDGQHLTMTANYKLIDYMNLEDKYLFDKGLEFFFPYAPYDLTVYLGSHTVTLSLDPDDDDYGWRFDGEPWVDYNDNP